MEIKKIVILNTQDAALLFKIKVGNKRTIFDAAMYKIAVLYSLAKKRNVYAYCELMKHYIAIEKLLHDLQFNINKSRKLIKKRVGHIEQVKIPVLEKHQLGFSNPIHFGLIQIIEKLDECVGLLILAKNSQVFTHQNGFYALKNKLRKQVFRLLSDINHINTKEWPTVNFNHYLSNDVIYKAAIAIYGELNPEFLYNAIHSAVTPTLSPGELNRMTAKLQRM